MGEPGNRRRKTAAVIISQILSRSTIPLRKKAPAPGVGTLVAYGGIDIHPEMRNRWAVDP